MSDVGHELTELELEKLERRIAKIYGEAAKELQQTIEAYFERFAERDEKQKALLEAGKITEEQYRQWRLNQIGRGERFKDLRDKIAERYTKANEVATTYVNDATPGIYSLNRNYAAYTIEQIAGNVGFTLWDEQTVKRLILENPGLMPYYPEARALRRGIDLIYGKQQITASITSGILQGKSIGRIADDLQRRIETMNRASAIRTARTAVTNAQNAGRQAAFEQAAKMGIQVRKRWIATKDMRTRHAHGAADGQTVDYDEPFNVGGEPLMFPGDDSGSPWNIYNCRCTVRTVEKEGIEAEPRQMRVRDPKTGRNVLVNEMTYAEWAGWKNHALKTVADMSSVEDIVVFAKSKRWFNADVDGIDANEIINLNGVDLEGAKAVYDAHEKFFKKYPQMVGKISGFGGAKLSKNTYADCFFGFGTGGITLNNTYFGDTEKFSKKFSLDVSSGFHPAGLTYKSIVTHELGHALDDYLTNQVGLVKGSKNKTASQWIRQMVAKKTKVKIGDMKAEVSEYAAESPMEWMAECFAEYMDSDSPRKVASAFGEILEEIMREVE